MTQTNVQSAMTVVPPADLRPNSEVLAGYIECLETFEIADDDDLQLVANIVNDIKHRAKALEELEKSVTRPILEGVERYRALFRPAREAAVEARALADDKIRLFHIQRQVAQRAAEAALQEAIVAQDAPAAAQAITALVVPTKVQGLAVIDQWDFEEKNHDIVPTSLTVLSSAAVKAEIKRQVAEGVPEPAIPGLRIFKTQVVRGTGR